LGVIPHISKDAIFISDEIGISKPNPKLYETALDRLELRAEEVMYVGDSPAHDIAPAKSLGMLTAFARRASRWAPIGEEQEADYVIDSFEELRDILREQHGLSV